MDEIESGAGFMSRRGRSLRRIEKILGAKALLGVAGMLVLAGSAVALLKHLGSYLAWCEWSGAPTLGSLGPLVNLALMVGLRAKQGMHSPAAAIAFVFLCMIFGFHAATRRGMARSEAAMAASAIALLLVSLVLRDSGRIHVALATSAIAAIVIALHPSLWRGRAPDEPRRAWLALFGALVVMLALVSRMYALAEHPHGYAEHAVEHNALALRFYEELTSAPAALTLGQIGDRAMVQFGLQSLLEATWFRLVGIGFLQSTFLPGLLGVGTVIAGYSLGRDLLGWKGGLILSYLFAVSSWQIAFSRYGDPEHILAVFQAAFTLALGVKAVRRVSAGLAWLTGMSLGFSWFVYGTNQILPVIALVCLVLLLLARRDLAATYVGCVAALLGGFLLVSGVAIYRNVASGHIYPIRAALPSNENYEVASLAQLIRSLPRAFSELLQQATDPWFSKRGGSLSDLEAVLLLPALAVGIVSIARRVDAEIWCLLLTGVVLSILPAIASAEVSGRRLLLVGFFGTCIVAASLVRILRLLQALVPRMVLTIVASLAVALHASASLHTYFVETHQEESERHAHATAIARFVVRHASEAAFKAFERDQTNAGIQYSFIRLAGYNRLADVRIMNPNSYLQYAFHPRALPAGKVDTGHCTPRRVIVIRGNDEEFFRETMAQAPAFAASIDWQSRTEHRDPQAMVSFLTLESRLCTW